MKIISCLLLIAAAPVLVPTSVLAAQVYTFTTIAGEVGVPGSSDGVSSQALFSGPAGLAIDAEGNLYVAEDGNHTIRKLTPVGADWLVTTIGGVAGESGSKDGALGENRFNRPRGLTVDSSGTLFVLDSYNSTVRSLKQSGTNWIASTLAGIPGVLDYADGVSTNALFRRPVGITVNPSGQLFVAEQINNVIRQLDLAGDEWSVITIAGYPLYAGWADGAGEDAEFSSPYGIVAAGEDRIYVADTGNNGIRQMEFDGWSWWVTTIAGVLNSPAGSADGEGTEARFYYPAGIARHESGTMFVSDQLNHTIRMLTSSASGWNVSTIGGSPLEPGADDGVGPEARFQRPWGIAVDPAGTVYVADLRNHTIRRGVPTSLSAGPALHVSLENGKVVISWPITPENYVLETTESLGLPSVWTELSDGITIATDSFHYTKENGEAGAFFRLRQP